jgi:hypothetical protein
MASMSPAVIGDRFSRAARSDARLRIAAAPLGVEARPGRRRNELEQLGGADELAAVGRVRDGVNAATLTAQAVVEFLAHDPVVAPLRGGDVEHTVLVAKTVPRRGARR